MSTVIPEPIDEAVTIWTERAVDDEGTDENAPTAKTDETIAEYSHFVWRKWVFIIACIVGTILVAGYALTVGDYTISFFDTYGVVWAHLTGNITDTTSDYVIWTLRMPRVCTGIIAGAGLGACGAVMQSILRNPLADPYTTGISSGASFGATLAMGLGLSVASAGYAIVANAFIFALVPMVVIIAVAKYKSSSPTTMIMAGIAIMYLFNAMSTMIKFYVDSDTLQEIFSWSVGSIDVKSWDSVYIMFSVTVVGLILMQLLSRMLNVMSTGDESARSIGVDAGKLRIISLLVISLVCAGIVSFTGLIGFIGLVCPHVARLVIGSDNRYLIPASAAFGSLLLLGADVVGRLVFGTIEVGVLTAFIGSPVFLYLILRQKKEVWRCRSWRWTMSPSAMRRTGP